MDASLSDSAKSVSSQEADEQAKGISLLKYPASSLKTLLFLAEELAARKTRVKQSLMKRARSVAIFTLKLKERRAREAAEKASKMAVTPSTPLPPPQCGGGELSCIPIEKVGVNFYYIFVDCCMFSLELKKKVHAVLSMEKSGV